MIGFLLVMLTAAISFVNGGSRQVAAEPAPDPLVDLPIASTAGTQTAVFAGGCFWGVEGVFEHLKGVSEVTTGYAGGSAETATYRMVSAGQTDHAESVQVVYDPTQVSYGELLKIYFFVAHDPTHLNRQGPDHGRQYRSAVFVTNDQEKQVAQAYIEQLTEAKAFSAPIVTQVSPLNNFYAAETYHQDFIERNPLHPYVVVHDLPKIRQLQAQFPNDYQ